MNLRSIFSAACLLTMASGLAPRAGASPVAIAVSPDGAQTFVAQTEPSSVAILDTHSGKIRATWPLPSDPTGLALSADGKTLWATVGLAPGRIVALDAATGKILSTVAAGHSPCAPVATPDGKRLFFCNRFENRIESLDTATRKITTAASAVREPSAAALRPDGRVLFVANRLPAGPANTGDISSAVTVVETATGAATAIRLPNGSVDLRGIACSPDGCFVYITHTLARYGLPTTQLDRGWMNTSALSILDAKNPRLLATVLLDEIDLGAANPAGVACSRDGRILAVAHSGTHEVSIIDLAALHKRIGKAARGEKATEVSKSLADLPNDLSFLHGIRQRVPLNGNGPRAVAATAGGFAVACYFSGSIHLLETGKDGRPKVRDIAPASPPPDDIARRGERLFHDASSCFQHWQSCITCHPGVRADALNWDLLNDGIGNPKQTKSMLFALETPPAMITGIRPNAETAIRAGLRHIQFTVRPEKDARAIEAFLRTLKPVPSPALVDGKLSESARRGKAVFETAGCIHCHSGPRFTDQKLHDIGLGRDREMGMEYDTPTLREVWRTAPYLYDGRAATLEEVIGKFNPRDQHGKTSRLTKEERRDLAEYLRSL
jgi:DNA-binding beta-propeller fold protein YncE/mono/diheme cytochrome c family protein